jgi:hypothetical protein
MRSERVLSALHWVVEYMRLTQEQRTEATTELIARLRANPAGLRTSELIGSLRFHGVDTLSPRQIIGLLRASGQVNEELAGSDYPALLWKAVSERS